MNFGSSGSGTRGGGGFGAPRPCISFPLGKCQYGEQCKFSHDASVQPDAAAMTSYRHGADISSGGDGPGGFKMCNAFATGNCTYGDKCAFSHGGAPPANPNFSSSSGGGFSRSKPCFAFQKGQCKDGDSCQYSHDPADNSGPNSIEFNRKPCFGWQNGTPYSPDPLLVVPIQSTAILTLHHLDFLSLSLSLSLSFLI